MADPTTSTPTAAQTAYHFGLFQNDRTPRSIAAAV
jgi:hypothetical protein